MSLSFIGIHTFHYYCIQTTLHTPNTPRHSQTRKHHPLHTTDSFPLYFPPQNSISHTNTTRLKDIQTKCIIWCKIARLTPTLQSNLCKLVTPNSNHKWQNKPSVPYPTYTQEHIHHSHRSTAWTLRVGHLYTDQLAHTIQPITAPHTSHAHHHAILQASRYRRHPAPSPSKLLSNNQHTVTTVLPHYICTKTCSPLTTPMQAQETLKNHKPTTPLLQA